MGRSLYACVCFHAWRSSLGKRNVVLHFDEVISPIPRRHLASSNGFSLWYPLSHTSRRRLMRNWIESLDMKGAPMQRMSVIVPIFGQSSKRYSRLKQCEQQDSDMLGISIGSTRSRSILDGYAPLHNWRLQLQGNVHTKEYWCGT